MAALGGTDLSTRVDVPSAPSEIKPVVNQLNDMLGRLKTVTVVLNHVIEFGFELSRTDRALKVIVVAYPL